MSSRPFPSILAAFAAIFVCSTVSAQSLSVSLVGSPDTTGMSASEQLALDKSVTLTLSSTGSSGDTLVVELGPSLGNYDLLTRKFPLSQTGTFADGCSLNPSGGGLEVGLGNYTGLSTFYVRAYLSSSGIGSAITVDND